MTTQIHHMKLKSAPFAMIARGEKTIESRLYDEKRQTIALGDSIIFTNTDDDTQALTVKVIGLLRYATFEAMFTHNDPAKFGGTNATELVTALKEYYSEDAQRHYGVLGIEIELTSDSRLAM